MKPHRHIYGEPQLKLSDFLIAALQCVGILSALIITFTLLGI